LRGFTRGLITLRALSGENDHPNDFHIFLRFSLLSAIFYLKFNALRHAIYFETLCQMNQPLTNINKNLQFAPEALSLSRLI